MNGLIVTTDGFEDSEFSYPYYRLREEGFDVQVATPDGDAAEGEHGYEFDADIDLSARDPDALAEEFDLLVVPGGRAPERLRTESPRAADVVAAFDEREKPVGAICHGAQLLISADAIDGRDVTGYWTLEVDVENAGATYVDEPVVTDGNLVTSRVPDDLPAFTRALFERAEPDADAAERATAD
ncbi:type 1 glutamine amidotransferase domain-containing protein [Halobaculum sp. D14]|uniref:type 1 glutamine amidotransferase domain-containing protein n=1 Tax=unclassified Halobaculum TaxID=2640896 RepID=UPI003EBF4F68